MTAEEQMGFIDFLLRKLSFQETLWWDEEDGQLSYCEVKGFMLSKYPKDGTYFISKMISDEKARDPSVDYDYETVIKGIKGFKEAAVEFIVSIVRVELLGTEVPEGAVPAPRNETLF